MSSASRLQTLFGPKLDRAVFATYFLGAVVPLLALAWVVHVYVLPHQGDDGLSVASLVGALMGVGLLSLAAFFSLRILTHTTLLRMKQDNQRLERLLVASRGLSRAPHSQAAASAAADYAREISGARAAVLVRVGKDEILEVYEAADDGSRALYEAQREELDPLAESALRDGAVARLENLASEPSVGAVVAVPVSSTTGVLGALVLFAPKNSEVLDGESVDAVKTLAALTAVALDNSKLQDSQRNFFAHTTELLASALDQHVENRAGHAMNVARLANRMGRALELGESDLQTLHYSCLLHDIGMLRIEPSRHRDARACRQHAALGARMLSRIQLWRDVAPIVLHHHERWDGTGYPEGLAGDAIPRASRIIAVADSVDAMRRSEGDRVGMTLDEVVAELEACAGAQFDPTIVAVFCRLSNAGHIDL